MTDILPWVEKYRPRTIDEIIGNSIIIDRFKLISQEGCIPNMIITGPPGTGKTSSILCLARILLGDKYKESIIELNASDECGIKVVRKKIKDFVRKKVILPPGRHKIVILDEADNMTPAAQQALRRLIENYSETTRFAFACNISSKIINPIQSRCVILRFTKLLPEQIMPRLNTIIDKENVQYDKTGLDELIRISNGDMRQILNNLQIVHIGFGKITVDNIKKICNIPDIAIIQQIIESCIKKDAHTAQELIMILYKDGYDPIDIINSFFEYIVYYDNNTFLEEIDKKILFTYIREIGKTHTRMISGMTNLLQLQGLIGNLCSY